MCWRNDARAIRRALCGSWIDRAGSDFDADYRRANDEPVLTLRPNDFDGGGHEGLVLAEPPGVPQAQLTGGGAKSGISSGRRLSLK